MSCPPSPDRLPLLDARRIVIKVGTRVLTETDGRLSLARLLGLVEVAAKLHEQGREILLVSSGAVGLGRDALGFGETPTDLADRQACAAVGQSRLMALYQDGFQKLGVGIAQVLLTEGDFEDRLRYLNLHRALGTLLDRKVIPVINENDVVATDEIALGEGNRVFGDNDRLSALVATKLGADLLVLLTDVDGVYDRDPRTDPGATCIPRIDDADTLTQVEAGAASGLGRGGMRSKVEAAGLAARGGCHAVVASGLDANALRHVVAGEGIGTWFPARGGLSARRRWIAFASRATGTLRLDTGAVTALTERGASLLAAGVTSVDGKFTAGDAVDLRGADGELVGRGLVEVDSNAARAWVEGTAPEGVRNRDALVHRDNLVLEETG